MNWEFFQWFMIIWLVGLLLTLITAHIDLRKRVKKLSDVIRRIEKLEKKGEDRWILINQSLAKIVVRIEDYLKEEKT